MFFLILLLAFGVVCYGIAGLPMMFDKGIGYFLIHTINNTTNSVSKNSAYIKYPIPLSNIIGNPAIP